MIIIWLIAIVFNNLSPIQTACTYGVNRVRSSVASANSADTCIRVLYLPYTWLLRT